jgi:acetyl-CoA carboxylase carboxyltransferase component
MSWKPEVEEIERRRALAREMGGEERIRRQHERGKLTARERVERLLDPGSFEEIGILADHTSRREEMKDVSAPADGVVTGGGEIDGRPIYLFSEDFTVLGGSTGQIDPRDTRPRIVHALRRARARRAQSTGPWTYHGIVP